MIDNVLCRIFCHLTQLLIRPKPSHHGEECFYNGEHTDFECRCDNCPFYLDCFPDWKDYLD